MGRRKKTTEQFVIEATKVHGDKYDYSKAVYIGALCKVCIICPTHGEFWQIASEHLNGSNCPMCARRRELVYGVGVNDYKDCVSNKGSQIKSYSVWVSMLDRCYGKKYKGRNLSYADCEVCDEWKLFSNFKKWFDENYKVGLFLDKDILYKGNRIYSPRTCCFVPNYINSLLVDAKSNRGKNKIGVVYRHHIKNKPYVASISIDGSMKQLGYYKTETEAYNVYRDYKKNYIANKAEEAFNKGDITRKVYDALLAWEISEH